MIENILIPIVGVAIVVMLVEIVVFLGMFLYVWIKSEFGEWKS